MPKILDETSSKEVSSNPCGPIFFIGMRGFLSFY